MDFVKLKKEIFEESYIDLINFLENEKKNKFIFHDFLAKLETALFVENDGENNEEISHATQKLRKYCDGSLNDCLEELLLNLKEKIILVIDNRNSK